jgi:integrase
MLKFGLSVAELEQLRWSRIDFVERTVAFQRYRMTLSQNFCEFLIEMLWRSESEEDLVFGQRTLQDISERLSRHTLRSPVGCIDLTTLELSYLGQAIRDGKLWPGKSYRVLQRFSSE